MRILQVVTLVSPDGAFGGPVRVAENQVAALRARGHDVMVAAGTRGFTGAPPEVIGSAPLRLFPLRRLIPPAGFSGMASGEMLGWLRKAVSQVDVVHVHLGRDLVTLPAAWLAHRRGVPYVVQPHGMVIESDNVLAGPLDALLTRRVLAGASAVFHLTPEERASLAVVGRLPIALHQLGNGVPHVDSPPPLPAQVEVLFCARLQERKRPLLFVEMAQTLLAEGVDARFVLVGPDEGLGAAVEAQIASGEQPDRISWEGPLDPSQTLARMARASMLVMPSVNEPYPMSVLEAMSVGRPVVVTDSCGLASAVRAHEAGFVVDSSRHALVDAVRTLICDPELANAYGRNAAAAAEREFGMAAVTDRLESHYRAATSQRGRVAALRRRTDEGGT